MIKIDCNDIGGEFDFCSCGEDGDNTTLYKVKNTNKFICYQCLERYKDAQELIKDFDKKYLGEVR